MLDCFFFYDYILISTNTFFTYTQLPFNSSFVYVIKFLLAIFFLIFIRAGLPRYRYDYLTILGWTRLLTVMLFIVMFNFFFFFIWF